MSRKKIKLTRFVAIPWEIIDSSAWRVLSNPARVAFVHLKRKVTKPHPGQLTLSYSEMEPFMERRTFARALKELEMVGLISKEQHGGLFRRRNYFSLSEEWRKFSNSSSGINATVTSGINATVGGIQDA